MRKVFSLGVLMAVLGASAAAQPVLPDVYRNETGQAIAVLAKGPGERSIYVRRDGTWIDAPQPAKPVMDVDGNVYQTTHVGRRVWMAENLRVTKLNDGSPIPLATSTAQWQALYTAGPAMMYYNFDPTDVQAFGALYDWAAVSTGKLCPVGWQVPSRKDFIDMEVSLGTQPPPDVVPNPLGVATAAQIIDGQDWAYAPSRKDRYAFRARPAGAFGTNGLRFWGRGTSTYFYTSEIVGDDPHFFAIYAIPDFPGTVSQGISRYTGLSPSDSRIFGLSVRCIRTENVQDYWSTL